MRTPLLKRGVLATIALFAVAISAPVAIGAIPAHAQEAQNTSETQRETAKTRLADAKLRACRKREKAINNIMARMNDRGAKQFDVFTKISERTQAFYADKGKTLNNYGALVAEVNAKKANAETVIANAKQASAAFKCDGTDPKGAVARFKEILKTQNEALKAYRTAVKNLIVGVKSVQGTTSSSDTRQSEGGEQ